MQSSEAVKSVFQDTHLLSTSLNRPEPTRYTKTTTNQRPRPVSGELFIVSFLANNLACLFVYKHSVRTSGKAYVRHLRGFSQIMKD